MEAQAEANPPFTMAHVGRNLPVFHGTGPRGWGGRLLPAGTPNSNALADPPSPPGRERNNLAWPKWRGQRSCVATRVRKNLRILMFQVEARLVE